MEFKKDDENYIYEVISKNVKKYRKLKGWTQEKLADEINYSLSFISGIESAYHQTFSLGAIWRISRALDVEFSKLCEDNSINNKSKFILYHCEKCGEETKFPLEMINLLKNLYEITGSKSLPTFNCSKEDCSGKQIPTNPMDF
ncbi:MAG: helix-turn-helix transcriptional regulator [Bacilli bacterium]|jgi:transcriptional regulator with XRE-family HTH domain|nr:helix-turn-helix transcriptional regulator [Bacilli bacterium]